MSGQPPQAPGQPHVPAHGSLRCPRCSATVGPEQDWCLECGAPARTRLAQTPNWQLPTVAIGAIVLIAGAMLAFAFVKLSSDGGAPAATIPAATVTTAAPPIVVAPTAPTPLPSATTPAQTTTTATTATTPGQTPLPPAPPATTQTTATTPPPTQTGTTPTRPTQTTTAPTRTAPRTTTTP